MKRNSKNNVYGFPASLALGSCKSESSSASCVAHNYTSCIEEMKESFRSILQESLQT